MLSFVALSFSRSTALGMRLALGSSERMKNLASARGASVYGLQMVIIGSPTVQAQASKAVTPDEDTEPATLEGEELVLPLFLKQLLEELGAEFRGSSGVGEEDEEEEEEEEEVIAEEGEEGEGVDEGKGWKFSTRPHKVKFGDRDCVVSLFDETAKLDLNRAIPEVLVRYFKAVGLTSSAVDGIVDSIRDWRDDDHFRYANGAENDYYLSLPHPYRARNGPFVTIEELSLVKGVTPELFDRVRRDLTVHGGYDTNVNFASRHVLEARVGLTGAQADAIISYRRRYEAFRSLDRVKKLLGGDLPKSALEKMTVAPSGWFNIISLCGGGGVQSMFRMLIQREGDKGIVRAVYVD